MDYEAELLSEARKAIVDHPEHRSAISQLYALAMCEIEDGESAAHEYELFLGSMEEIKHIKENQNE